MKTASPYEDPLSNSHVTTQECLKTRALATEVYDVVNGRTPSYIQQLFEVKETPYNLRDCSKTIIPKTNSTTYVLTSFKHGGNKIWNSLPVDIRTSESLAIFKRKISKWQPRY